MFTRSLTAALAPALILATTGLAMTPALAEETQTQRAGVQYDDLDLSTEDGRKELERRIDNAAKEACSAGGHEVGSYIRSREERRCYNSAKRQLEERFVEVLAAAQTSR